MLQFFRRHQKLLFIFTTIIIITSFAFFGTYQAFAPSRVERDSVVGYTIHGKKIRQNYLSQMCFFLSNEGTPGFQSRQLPIGNIFNDGVITKDFLQTGMANLLVRHFSTEFKDELENRLIKEKNYTPYVHPNVPTLSAELAWSYFAPEMSEHLKALQKCESAIDSQGFERRVALFLAERAFPPAYLGQVLRYQLRENPNIAADHRIMREDFSLFGYQDLQDWFGQSFIECTAQIIMNCAQIARKQGYHVSREEVLSDLLYRSEKAFSTLKKEHVALPVNNSRDFFQICLRQMGMEEATLISIWEEVTLFRRLFHDVGSGALVDSLPIENFSEFVNQYATIALTQMPEHLRFQTPEALKRFEIYLQAVCGEERDLLSLPLTHESLDIIEQKAPELVGKRLRFYAGHVAKASLQSKVSVKETWAWELQSENWNVLKERFPELASKTEEPFEALESLESRMRSRVDAFARSQIVNAHPEWIDDALKEVSMEEKSYFANGEPTQKILTGIHDIKAFIAELEKGQELNRYTQDEENYYRILAMDASQEKELLTFQQAIQEGVFTSLEKRINGDELLQNLFTHLEKNFGKNEEKELIARRFFNHLKEYNEEKMEGAFCSQWKPIKIEKNISRIEPSFIPFEQILLFEPEQKSDILVDLKEGAYSFSLLERKIDTSLSNEKMVEAQEILSQEIRCHYLEDILSLIDQKKSIVFSHDA